MSVYVDVSSAVHAKAGLGRYASELALHLYPLLGDRMRLFQNNLGTKGPLPNWPGNPAIGVRWGYRPWRSLVWASQLLGTRMDRLLPNGELFHGTEHLLPRLDMPTVLTVHDLIFERFPEHHKALNHQYLTRAMPLYVRRASRIIAISESTRRDLVEIYGTDPNKISVVYEAASPRFYAQSSEAVTRVREQYNLPERYLLTVGTIEPRKNLTRLVDACKRVFDRDLADGLVIVGGRGWLYEGFFQHLDELDWRDRVVMPGFVADADLPAVYAGASVVVQPSVYEGFGLPVLEAMACGAPVCASGISSLPEIGGGAALYFDPYDVDAIGETICELLKDEERRSVLSKRGLARSREFSWERTAAETVQVYDTVLGSNNGA